MRLATIENGEPDGRLVVVSADGHRLAEVPGRTMLSVLANWEAAQDPLRDIVDRLEAGGGSPVDAVQLKAPFPRTWQWLDGSAFGSHGKLMQIAFGLPAIETDRPLMYQGLSDRFIGPGEHVPLPSEDDGIDFEGEFGVVVDHVPMGTSSEQALDHIKLVVQINDWSLRTIAPIEMKTGFGWIQAKPACSMAPYAVTPGELGAAWRDGRVCLDLAIELNGQFFGNANGALMDVGFHELVAHAARTRDLVAGTIIGSGTVSNPNYDEVGSSCISEIRAIETIRNGKPETPFMSFGDTVRMAAVSPSGRLPFGAIEQQVVQA